jgi:hypothetical protein
MSLTTQTPSTLYILATILSASSLALASSPSAASPQRLPRLPDLPPWSLSLPARRLDRNLEEIHYSEKVVRVHVDLDDGSETLGDSYVLLDTDDEVRLSSLALTERELETLPRDNTALMTHGLRTSSEWFEPSAPTETALPALIPAADESDYNDSAYFLRCNWHHRMYIGITSGLVFALMTVGMMLVLKVFWRRNRQARRKARGEKLGFGFVQREVVAESVTEIEKAGLL